MINNNILLITDENEISDLLLSKLILLRENDKVEVCELKDYKKILEKSVFPVVILHEADKPEYTFKIIKNIKEQYPDSEILLLLNKQNKELILKAYDAGIFDYFFTDSEDYEMLIKTVNCFKFRINKEKGLRNEKFLYQLGVIDSKTNLYEYKYLKEIFIDLSDNLRIKNGIFCVMSLDEKVKTKVSTNRLAGIIKNSLRKDDIAATARGGKFYLILPNLDLFGVKAVIDKIQNKIGKDFQIRAGFAKIGIRSFETLDKIANDSLISASQNNLTSVCLEYNNINIQNSWLEDDAGFELQKAFKLFKNAFTNKMDNIVSPLFFRFQKDFETKLTNTQISQYANDIESVFSLKNENLHSELIIRYDGYAKFNIKITHSGLNSAEDTKIELPLNGLTNKSLTALLKQLKDEYKQTAYTKGE